MTESHPTRSQNQSERADQTRARIIDAATTEFSLYGLAGARTERIAEAAGVNKALIYYYFESKENLYSTVLDRAAKDVRDRSMASFLKPVSAGERVLRAVLDHFDRILSQQEFQRLMQQEMMRLHKGESDALAILVKRVFAPLQAMFQSMIREGMEAGELIESDILTIPMATFGANVFYVLSAPVWRLVVEFEPFAPEVLAERRKLLVEFWGQALFKDRKHGAELAARVLADTPMPEFRTDLLTWGKNNERAQ